MPLLPMAPGPFAMLHQTSAMYSGTALENAYTPLSEDDEVLAELLPEDAERFHEIVALHSDVHRLAGVLHRKMDRIHALRTLFWDDVRTRYEQVYMHNGEGFGIRVTGEDGKQPVVVAEVKK